MLMDDKENEKFDDEFALKNEAVPAEETKEETGSAGLKKGKFRPGKKAACFGAGVAAGLILSFILFMIFNPDKKEKRILELIEENAITDATEEEIKEGKYDGMLEALGDKYAAYYTAEETEANSEKRSGSYEGIGLLVAAQDDGSFIVSGVYADSPAEEAGIKAGDIIVKAGETSVVNETYVDDDHADEGTSLTELLQMIADMGDEITLTMKRDEAELTFTLTPREIVLTSVYYEMKDESIGFIRIEKFNKTTADQFDAAITDLTDQGMKALIVDLRNNGGGLVDQTRSCLERILPEGLMFYTEEKDGTREEFSSQGETPLEVPMAILVNGSTASASEIFAGACRDQLGAILVGETTYGKGIIQTTTTLEDGSSVKFTTAHYYTPKGTDLNGVGLEPDVASEIEVAEGVTQIEAGSEEDTQYQAAVEALKNRME